MSRHMKPLDALKKTVDSLKQQIDDLVHSAVEKEIGQLREAQKHHGQKIESLEAAKAESELAARDRFVIKADLDKMDERRDEQFAEVNEKLDRALENDSAQNEALQTIKEQVKEIFHRINRVT